jgi:tetratricopeptide (TPR) repeat protein/tRNA A-37 threonylcarbamoyl transferase component Bud32
VGIYKNRQAQQDLLPPLAASGDAFLFCNEERRSPSCNHMDNKPSVRSSELLDVLAECGLPPDAPEVGPYFLGELLGESAVATVTLAIDPILMRSVAVKQLRPELAQDPAVRAQFRNEARALAQVEDHGVVRLYETGLDRRDPYIAMEFLPGRTLEDFARAFSPLPPHPVMAILCDLLRTLIPVHEAGLVHGGLKLSRVIIHSESVGRMVVRGFGEAVILDLEEDSEDEVPLAPRGPWTGEFGDAAPEQLLGEPVSAKADQFSLAVMAYELLTGRRPFAGHTVEEQLDFIRRQHYIRLCDANPQVPEALAEVIEPGLRYDPKDRWPDLATPARSLERGLRQDLFEDATVELRPLFADPPRYLGRIPERVVAALGQKALTLAAQGDTAAAVAECRRVLVWRPTDRRFEELLQKLQSISNGESRKMQAALAEDAAMQARALAQGQPVAEMLPTLEASLMPPEPRPSAVVLKESESAAPQADAVAETKPENESESSSPSRARWAIGGIAAGTLLAVALLLGLRFYRSKPTMAGGVVSTGLEKVLPRPLEVRPFPPRLNEPTLASYRPVHREGEQGSGQGLPVQINLQALGQLEKKGDLHALAIGSLLKGDPGSGERALAYLDEIDPPFREETVGKILKLRLSPSRNPNIDSERAAVLLELKRPAEAFRLASSALLVQPDHPAAQWNQALALQDLDLTGSATAVFGRIKASGEPGWSGEAGVRMAALQVADETKRRLFEEMLAKGNAMVAGGPAVPEVAETASGYAQLFLYDAVRTATSAARVLELLPLAQALDVRNSTDVLERHVRKIASKFSARRAQLAGIYAQLVTNPKALSREAQEDYFAQLRTASEGDLLIGAMIQTDRVGDHLTEFKELARSIGDPWFDQLAENEAANVEMARGEYRQAEEHLLAARTKCGEHGLAFRCVRLEISLVRLYISLLALSEAEMHVKTGLDLARKTGDWEAETTFLADLSRLAYHRNNSALSRAYVDEIALREPNGCDWQRFVHELRAIDHLIDLRFEEARREILGAPLCGKPRSLTSLIVMTNLDRVGLPVMPLAQVREEFATLRRQGGLSPSRLAVVEYAEGLLVIQHDRQEGRTILLRSIDMAKRLPNWDTGARKVIFHSYEELSLDYARAGKPREALMTIAEQQSLPPPSQCVIGVLLSDERTLVARLDTHGMADQHYEPRRSSPDIDLPHLVPDDFKAALRGCSHVDVFAHPLLHRSPDLLPSDINWSFRGDSLVPASPRSGTYHQLIVRDAALSPAIGVRPRAPWSPDVVANSTRTILEGEAATPSNILKGMQGASEILIDAPCITANGEEYLALSTGSDRQYALTGRMVLRNPLPHRPVIVLFDGCGARVTLYRHEPWSLPMSFRQAGASAVFSVIGSIPDVEGRQFLDKVLKRTHAGQRPSAALWDERMIWRKEKNREWVTNIAVFD